MDLLRAHYANGRRFQPGELIERGQRVAVGLNVTDARWSGDVRVYKVFAFNDAGRIVEMRDCADRADALAALESPEEQSGAEESERVRRYYDKTAPKYDRAMRFWDGLLFRGGREWACAQAAGRTLEIGVGTGRNLPFYPAEVELVGVDPSERMLAIARERASQLGRAAELRLGDAQALEFADESFDTVVSTLSLCTIPDERQAIEEAWRVLRPGGKFVLLEHVRSDTPLVRMTQRLLDPLSVRFAADHLVREPLEHLRAHGFEVEAVERGRRGIVERAVARKPAE